MAKICVIGGSGFLGRHVIARLAAAGHFVTAPTRRFERAKHLLLLPTVEVVEARVLDEAALCKLVGGCDAVINLAGVLFSRPAASADPPYGREFARAHVELPSLLVASCIKSNVSRLVHVSALGASADAPSEYLRSKAGGESAFAGARERLACTVFRPSVIFGPEDRFLNMFAQLQRWLPMLFLACPQARFQPVHVDDVAACITKSLFDREAFHRSFDLCGPEVWTLREMVAFAGRASGNRRPIVGLSNGLSYAQACAMELLPVKLMSRDNVRSMRIDSVCRCEFPFGMRPIALETAAAYLTREIPRFSRLRGRAGR